MNRNKLAIIPMLAVLLLLFFIGCAEPTTPANDAPQAPPPSVPPDAQETDVPEAPPEAPVEVPPEVPQKQELPFADISVSVSEKTNIPENIDQGRYSDRVSFTFVIENGSDKAIKGIQGVLEVRDLFGEPLISIHADLTGTDVPANESAAISDIGMDINQFIDEHVKLYNEAFDDLQFAYRISDVVYTDSARAQNVATSTDHNATVTVAHKYNLSENWEVGRYSPRVAFDFVLSNLSDKDIKGIQGILVISDMFGEEIIGFNCDFTGNDIPANGQITVTDLGVDINQFIAEDMKLYNELYEDLIFEYTITKIVYSDGTVAE